VFTLGPYGTDRLIECAVIELGSGFYGCAGSVLATGNVPARGGNPSPVNTLTRPERVTANDDLA
jgi:hypothetical protein